VRGQRAQRCEGDAAKLAPGKGQVVCDISDREAELAGQVLVGEPRLALALQVVQLEQPKVDRFAARLALGAQSFNREAEQVAYPLLLKKLLHCARSRRLAACQFTFGGLEIERHQDRVAAAFDAPRRLVLVGRKTVRAGPQKSSQARLRGIVTVQKACTHP